MTHVSRRKLKPPTQKLFSSIMLMLFNNVDKKELRGVFETIFTKTEKEMLAKRIVIIMLLNYGVGPKIIAESTNSTIQTVSRIKLQLNEVSPTDKAYVFSRLARYLLIKDVKNTVRKILSSIPTRSSILRDLNKGW